jgi:hypothetical protein
MVDLEINGMAVAIITCGGVDIADQLRAGFSTQQREVKPWRLLFYWLLDIAVINAYCLSKHQRKAQLGCTKDKVRSAYRAFREALVLVLLRDPLPKAPTRSYITKDAVLPSIPLDRPIGIHKRILGKRAICVFCRWSRVTKKGTVRRLPKQQMCLKQDY